MDDTTLEVLELPVGKWTTKYKEDLEKLMDGANPLVSEYRDYNTDCRVKFEIVIPNLSAMSDADIEKSLHLTSKIAISNLTLFDSTGRIIKYASPEAILRDWYGIRLKCYGDRKVTVHYLTLKYFRHIWRENSSRPFQN